MAKDRYEIDFSDDPVFNSVTGLTNIAFNPSNIRSGHMATEDQLLDLYNRTIDAEQNLTSCCKKLLVWEAYAQVVRLHTNTLHKGNGGVILPAFSAGGVVVSPFNQNKSVGFMRRGDDYTITFSLPWDDTLYCPVTPAADGNCNAYQPNQSWTFTEFLNRVSYRRRGDSSIVNPCTTVATNKRAYFFTNVLSKDTLDNNNLYEINRYNQWGAFTRTIGVGGRISITDHRRLENFNIIRYYTQFTLNECSDGTLLRPVIEPVIAEWNASHSESEQLLYAP